MPSHSSLFDSLPMPGFRSFPKIKILCNNDHSFFGNGLIRFGCLLLCLSHLSLALAQDDDDDDTVAKPQATQASRPSVQTQVSSVNQAQIKLAGIETMVLKNVQKRPELVAHASVLSLEPLMTLRQQYRAASAIQDGAHAKYQEATLNLARSRELYQQDIISTRRLQEQLALSQSEKANVGNAAAQRQALLATSQWQWGETLSNWFVLGNDKSAEPFVKRHAQLLSITLPANSPSHAAFKIAFVDVQGRRDQAHATQLIARAPQVDPITQGARYFFKLEGQNLPLGARLTAWLPLAGEEQSGVIVPNSAIVWHLGQACVFVKAAADHFNRKVLSEFTPSPGGYFVNSVLRDGDEIVISGAQTLLSQELKNQIPSEDDD